MLVCVSVGRSVSEKFSFELFYGAKDLLHRLKAAHFRLHLWTARDEKSARHILNSHGIESLFDTLSFATAADSKPHANSLKFDWRDAPKNSVLMIGDSPADMIGSKNIGAISVAALWDHHSHEHSLISSGAELFFYSLKEFDHWAQSKIKGNT